ncbi:MAG: hypothetical protein ACYS22_01240 [Planctomycetota bacterium]
MLAQLGAVPYHIVAEHHHDGDGRTSSASHDGAQRGANHHSAHAHHGAGHDHAHEPPADHSHLPVPDDHRHPAGHDHSGSDHAVVARAHQGSTATVFAAWAIPLGDAAALVPDLTRFSRFRLDLTAHPPGTSLSVGPARGPPSCS